MVSKLLQIMHEDLRALFFLILSYRHSLFIMNSCVGCDIKIKRRQGTIHHLSLYLETTFCFLPKDWSYSLVGKCGVLIWINWVSWQNLTENLKLIFISGWASKMKEAPKQSKLSNYWGNQSKSFCTISTNYDRNWLLVNLFHFFHMHWL